MNVLTCGSCRHWKRLPTDPHNIAAPPFGECRERVHSALTPMPTPGGLAITQQSYYPRLPMLYEACGQYKPQVTATSAYEEITG